MVGLNTTMASAQVIPKMKNNKTPAEWTTLRGNNNRDGRVLSKGEFKNSTRLLQSIDFATAEAYLELSPAKTNSTIRFNAGETNDSLQYQRLTKEWQTENEAYLDLYGNGSITKVSVSQSIKYAKLFKGDNIFYRISALDGFSFGNSDTTYVGFRIYEANTDKLVLDRRFKKGVYMQRPHVLVDDMNNDGEKDIIITSWEGVYVFNNKGDSIAGLSQNVSGWHHLRKRGFACVADVDNNGYRDVVIIGAYPYHLDVIKNDNGKLKFGWTTIFDAYVESAKKISKPISNSVTDFDGDGTTEILVNVYNYNDDKNWAAVLFDPVNGKVKAQIKNSFVTSASDVNSNGEYIFFCTATKGQSIPISGTLKVFTFAKGAIKELWRVDKAKWISPRVVNTSPSLTTHVDGVSSLAEANVVCLDYENIGQKAFFTVEEKPDGSTSILAYYASKEGKVRKAPMTIDIPSGMYGDILRERKNGDGTHTLLLQLKTFGTPSAIVKTTNAHAKKLGRFIASNSKTFIPVAADINADGQAEIIIPNDVGEVLCFARNDGGKMSLRWKVPGHGMLYQYSRLIDYGISVDDLDHDGYKEVIVSGGTEMGAAIFVYDYNGKLLWKKDFPDINAGDVTTFDGNLAFYGTAQSSNRKARDVVVTVQRVIQHTGRTYCLGGNNGAVIWELDTLTADKGPGQGKPVISGAGGNIFSTYDIDGDGSDEVMCGFGNIVFIADVNDGSIKFKSFMRKLFLDDYDYLAKGFSSFWIAEILPVAFRDAGKMALSCFNVSLAAGTMNVTGPLSWSSRALDYAGRYWQCMADLDGNGKLWVVELSTRKSDNKKLLFAYDPVNGEAYKSFSLELAGFMPLACDVNGDGKDEIIVSNSTGVYCVGNDNGKPTISWKYDALGCGPAIVADVDADGFVEVITATQQGRILIIDK